MDFRSAEEATMAILHSSVPEEIQPDDTPTEGVHTNGKGSESSKNPSARPHRSEMPPPGRKQTFEEAVPQILERHAELLRRLAK